jgi:hypothetical protein
VSGKSRENEAICGFFPYPEALGPSPSWAVAVVRDGEDEKMVPTEAVGCKRAGSGEAKMQILVNRFRR